MNGNNSKDDDDLRDDEDDGSGGTAGRPDLHHLLLWFRQVGMPRRSLHGRVFWILGLRQPSNQSPVRDESLKPRP
jgi:hypothetical protein